MQSIKAKFKSLLLTGIIGVTFSVGYFGATKIVKADEVATDEQNSDTVTVTAHYQDEKGNQLAEDQVIAGHINVSYGTNRKAIEGYNLKDWQGPTEGYFQDQPLTVTYIYEGSKNSAVDKPKPAASHQGPETADPSKRPETGDPNKEQAKENSKSEKQSADQKSDQTAQGQVVPASTQTEAQLPQTGMNHQASLGMIIAGIAALSLSLLGIYKKQKTSVK